MKSRLTLISVALTVLLGAMAWLVLDRLTGPSVIPAMAAAAAPRVVVVEQAALPASALLPPVTTVEIPAETALPSPMVHVAETGDVKYVARAGDTVSELAIALCGSDSKVHRDAVIAANPPLQADPDRVLEGTTYSVGRAVAPPKGLTDMNQPAEPAAALVPAVATIQQDPSRVRTPAASVIGPELKYTAQSGDTVSGLAANLLGADTTANRESIVAGNASLQKDPDHLVAGKSYTIVAPNGLAADPNAAPAKVPATQPDADDVVREGNGRVVRYTAQPGDTVSKLAVVLLGSDTSANRELIVKNNRSLIQNPDYLVAGQVYWIAVPKPDAMP